MGRLADNGLHVKEYGEFNIEEPNAPALYNYNRKWYIMKVQSVNPAAVTNGIKSCQSPDVMLSINTTDSISGCRLKGLSGTPRDFFRKVTSLYVHRVTQCITDLFGVLWFCYTTTSFWLVLVHKLTSMMQCRLKFNFLEVFWQLCIMKLIEHNFFVCKSAPCASTHGNHDCIRKIWKKNLNWLSVLIAQIKAH